MIHITRGTVTHTSIKISTTLNSKLNVIFLKNNLIKGVPIDPTAPFEMYWVGCREFKSPYINACRVNSNEDN